LVKTQFAQSRHRAEADTCDPGAASPPEGPWWNAGPGPARGTCGARPRLMRSAPGLAP